MKINKDCGFGKLINIKNGNLLFNSLFIVIDIFGDVKTNFE